MFHLGTTELIIILVIVLLLFGAGRISKVAGELGKGLREFRQGMGGKKDETAETKDDKENIDPK